MDIIKTKPDKRTIWWFWESEGNVGKSALVKYLVVKHDALMITGKSNDIYYIKSKIPSKRKLFICDISRSVMEYVNYGAIEQIKNGLESVCHKSKSKVWEEYWDTDQYFLTKKMSCKKMVAN